MQEYTSNEYNLELTIDKLNLQLFFKFIFRKTKRKWTQNDDILEWENICIFKWPKPKVMLLCQFYILKTNLSRNLYIKNW